MLLPQLLLPLRIAISAFGTRRTWRFTLTFALGAGRQHRSALGTHFTILGGFNSHASLVVLFRIRLSLQFSTSVAFYFVGLCCFSAVDGADAGRLNFTVR